MFHFKFIKSDLFNSLVLIILLTFSNVDSKAAKPDTLFLSDEVIRMELHADFSAIQKDRDQDPKEHKGRLIYYTSSGETVNLPVNVTTRGNFRLDPANCKFPPLMIDFKKSQVRNTLFDNQDKLKLVTPCNNEQDVINEYLVYKMYNRVTDLSMNVRLVKILYYDDRRDKKLFEQHSFFIEDKDHAAARNNASELNIFATPFDLVEDNAKKLSVFQYLIGNKDWFISSRKNIVIMQSKDSSYLYAVPYDFDMAGFVDADYTKPTGVPENLLSDRRVYKGVCYSYNELKEIFEFYHELRPSFEAFIKGQELISGSRKREIIEYLNRSYLIMKNSDLVAEKFINMCETRKHYNLPER